jgi:DnaJ-domain-containing protein 1
MNPIKALSKNISAIYKSSKPGYLCMVVKLNHFQIFGLETMYSINKTNINSQYNSIKQQLNNSSLKGSRLLKDYINNAYLTIKDDYDRAVYILLLNDIVVDEKDKLSCINYIEEIRYIKERIDENPYELMAIKEEVNERIEELKYDLNENIELREFNKAREQCILLNMYMNINEELHYKINE